MNLKELQMHWNEFGRIDPFYAILTYEGKNDQRWDAEEFFASGEKQVDDLMNELQSLDLKVRLGKALDFGCGVGRLTQALAQYFAEISGVDIAPSMIELANEYNRHGNRCRYYLNSSSNLNLFDDDSFDFVYSHITLQHMAPRYSKRYIKEFLRILAPGGLLAFQLPTAPLVAHQGDFRRPLKSLVPKRLLTHYRKLRYGGLKPVMQMHGVEKSVVMELLEKNEAVVLDVKQHPMEEGWVSNSYIVRKNNSILRAVDY